MLRDHGGNLDAAMARHGGDGWIDLSTGINRRPYPLPPLPASAWTDLPTGAAKTALVRAARAAFGTDAPGIALTGAQAAIQMVPWLARPGLARVVSPTYNEHAATLLAAGWRVEEVGSPADLPGADLGVVVNPNNPDGRRHDPARLRELSRQVGRLVVDESFADADGALSVAAHADGRLIVLRSFGKFWGLAGMRLGFAFADAATIARLEALAGPWPVSGPALEIGRLALPDRAWAAATAARLAGDARRLDGLAAAAGWTLVGGTALFRTYATPDAGAAQDHLARHRIWSRIFPWSARWLRLGLPGAEAEWTRLDGALAAGR